jgi:hypothetical protein
MESALLEIFGKLVLYAGGGAAIAVGVFQFLGKSYIDHKFAARIEALKHDQSVIVAKLKVEIDSMLSGALKFQERDFTVLPGVWDKLDLAFINIRWYVSPLQTESDISRLSDSELNEFLDGDEMMEMQKQQVRDADRRDRQKVWSDIKFLYKTASVRKIYGEYQRFLASNAIFFSEELKAKLKEMEALLWSSISKKMVGVEGRDFKLQNEGWKVLEEEAGPLRDQIELLIRKRLASHVQASQGSNA